MTADTIPDCGRCLADLISPVDMESFWREFWPDQPFVAHGPLERLPGVFSDPRLSDLSALSSHYRGRVLFSRGRSGPRSILVQNVEAAPLYDMGLSLYLPDIEAMLPEAGVVLRTLERELGLAEGDARITAWASPAADGIACHFDAEDVFSIQLAGTKRFHVAETPALIHPVGAQYGPGIPPSADLYPQVPAGFPDPDDFAFTEIVMLPGSVLFVPRGLWHRTEADADSLSISIILSPASTADILLGRLRDLLLQDPAWRRPALGPPRRIDHPGGAEGWAADLLRELPHVVASITPADLVGMRWDARESIGPGTLFQRIPETRRGEEPEFGSETGEETFLEWIDRTTAAFTVSEASGHCASIGPERLEALLMRLVDAGVVRRLPYRRLERR